MAAASKEAQRAELQKTIWRIDLTDAARQILCLPGKGANATQSIKTEKARE